MVSNTKNKRPAYLRRYTDLPSLLHILGTKKLTLLDPKTWDDKNDQYFMSLYKGASGLRSLLALCFSESPEKYHHWRVFSHGPSGVCIYFKKKELVRRFETIRQLKSKKIKYLTLDKAEKAKLTKLDLPFVKRYGYQDEKEYRVIYSSISAKKEFFDVEIDIDWIAKITLSPWMNKNLAQATIRAIRSANGCGDLKILRSTLISNAQWRVIGEEALNEK